MTRDEINLTIASVQAHLDMAERGLKALHDAKANESFGLTWDAFMREHFDRSARWLYHQLHALDVRDTLAVLLPEDERAQLFALPESVLREFTKPNKSIWADVWETAQGIALDRDSAVTAAIVSEAATVYSEAIEQGSVYGVPLVEVVATGACEERRNRIAAHSNRVYLADNAEVSDSRIQVFSSRLMEVYIPSDVIIPDGVTLKAAIWYEVPDDLD
jgi:hypothetical protein